MSQRGAPGADEHRGVGQRGSTHVSRMAPLWPLHGLRSRAAKGYLCMPSFLATKLSHEFRSDWPPMVTAGSCHLWRQGWTGTGSAGQYLVPATTIVAASSGHILDLWLTPVLLDGGRLRACSLPSSPDSWV